jgi:hypothetical protein
MQDWCQVPWPEIVCFWYLFEGKQVRFFVLAFWARGGGGIGRGKATGVSGAVEVPTKM